MNVICVCEKCHEHSNEKETVIEINFSDKKMYFKCPSCKHVNSIEIEKKNFKFPRGKLI